MKKKRLNALLAAGCLTFLAPVSAHATDNFTGDYSTTTTKTVTDNTGATFTTINVQDTGTTQTTLTINAKNGVVNPIAPGKVTLNNTSIIEFADAVNDITFTTTDVKGTNTVKFDAPTSGTAKTATLGAVTVDQATPTSETSLTVTSNAGTTELTTLTLQGTTDTAATPKQSKFIVNGSSGAVKITGTTTVQNKGNVIQKDAAVSPSTTTPSLELNNINIEENAGLEIKANSAISQTSDKTVTLKNGAELTTSGTGALTLQNVAIAANATSSTIINTNNNDNSKITTITLGSGSTTNLNGVNATVLFATADGSTTNLENTTEIDQTVVSGTTTIGQGTTYTATSTDKVINLKDTTSKSKDILLDTSATEATLTLENIKLANNYEYVGATETSTKNITYNLKNSDLGSTYAEKGEYYASTINAGQKATVNSLKSDAEGAKNTIGLFYLTKGTSSDESGKTVLTLNTGDTTTGAELTPYNLAGTGTLSEISLNNNTQLNLKGENNITLGGVSLTSEAAEGSNPAASATAYIATSDNATPSTQSRTYNVGNIYLEGESNTTTPASPYLATLNLNNSVEKITLQADGVSLSGNSTLNINGNATTQTGAIIAHNGSNKIVNENTKATIGTVAIGKNITSKEASLTGFYNGALEVQASQNTNIGEITVTGKTDAKNIGTLSKSTLTLTVDSGKTLKTDKINLSGNANMTTSGAGNITSTNGIAVTGANNVATVVSTGTNNLGALTVGSSSEKSDLTLSTSSNLNLGTTTIQGKDNNNVSNLSATIASGKTLTTDKINLSGNANMTTTGAGNITSTNGIAVTGANNVATISSTGTNSLGALAVGSSSAKGDLSLTANSNTTIGATTITGKDTNSQLSLNAATGKTLGVSGVTLNDKSALTIDSSNAGTVTLGDLNVASGATTTLTNIKDGNYTNSTLANNATVNLNGSYLRTTKGSGTTADSLAVGANNNLTLNATGNNSTVAATTLAAGTDGTTTLNLSADTGKTLGVSGVALNNKTELAISSSNAGTVTLGDLNVASGATTTLTNVATGNYNGTTLGNNATVNLNNSYLRTTKGSSDSLAVSSNNTLSINSTGTTSNIAATTLAAGTGGTTGTTTLNLSADESKKLTTGIITLNANSKLNTSGKGELDIAGVNVVGNSTIDNKNQSTATNFGEISLSNGVLTAIGINPSNATIKFNGGSLAGGGDLGDFEVSENKTSTITVATGETVTFGTATLVAGTGEGTTELTLNAEGGNIAHNTSSTTTTIEMNGKNKLNLNHTSPYTVEVGNVKVTGTDNTINNQASTSQTIGNIAYQENNSAVKLDGTGSFQVNSIDVNNENNFENKLTTDVNTTISDIVFNNASDKLNLEATSGTTTITKVTDSTGVGIDLNLNANGGAISTTDAIAMNGNSSIATSGASNISISKINVASGKQSNTIANDNANTTITYIELLQGTGTETTNLTKLSVTPTKDLSTSLTLDGNSELTIASGAGKLTSTTTTATNANNKIINNDADSTLTALNVQGDLEIQAGAATGYGTATVTNGKTLTLNAKDEKISSSGLTTLNNGQLTLNGAQEINLNNIQVSGGTAATSNIITNNNTSSKLGTIAVDDATTLKLSNVKSTNHSTVTLGDGSVANLDNSELGNIDIAENSTTINAQGSTASSVGTIGATTPTTGELTLNAENGATLTSGATTLGDGAKLNMNGKGKVAISGVNVTGTTSITKSNDYKTENDTSTFGAIKLNDAVLTVTGLKADDHTFTFDTTATDNTIYANNSALGDMTAPSAKTLTINAETEGITYGDIALSTGSSKETPTTLTLDAKANGLAGSSLTLQQNATVNFKGTGTETGKTNRLTGDINVSKSNNSLDNQSAATVTANQLVFNEKNTTIDLKGSKGFTFTDGTALNANSTINNSNTDTVDLGTLDFNANDALTLNANAGTTKITDFHKVDENANIDIILNANGGKIEKTSDTSISTSDTLKLTGTTEINMGKITVSDSGKLELDNDNANFNEIVLNDTATISTDNGNINDISIKKLSLGENSQAKWTLDFDETNKTSDTLSIGNAEDFDKNLNFELSAMNPIDNELEENKYVKYINLIESNVPVLATTEVYDEKGEVSGIVKNIGDNTYYSYDANTYETNTVRVTNYNIMADQLLDYLTDNRSFSQTLSNGKHDATLGEVSAYPNMQVRDNEAREFTLNSAYPISGTKTVGSLKAQTQIFTIDATDTSQSTTTDRTFNLNGASVNEAYSNSTDPDRFNHGSGAALYVKTADDTGKVTVNLAPYQTDGFIETDKDELNTDVYSEYNDTKTGIKYTIKDVAFAGNESSDNGGAIYNTGAKSTITTKSLKDGGVAFRNNTAGQNGGAIYNDNGAKFTSIAGKTDVGTESYISSGGMTLENNTAGGKGGAIYNNSNLEVQGNMVATGNTATDKGGAIYNNGGEVKIATGYEGSTTVTTTAFLKNTSSSDGGAIYNENGNLTIGRADHNSINVFASNSAVGNGGAHASVNNDLVVNGDTIYASNHSDGNGGAISVVGSNANLYGSQTFTSNTAGGKGGAIYAVGSYNADGTLKQEAIINLTANKTSTFEDNMQNTKTVDDVTTGDSNAIYLDGDVTINITTEGQGKYVFNDEIASAHENNHINQTGTVYYNENMSAYNGTFKLNSGDAYFTDANSVPFQGGNYILNGGSTLHLDNGTTSTISVNSLDLSGTTSSNPANITIDMDMAKEVADHFEVANPTSGNLLVTDIRTKNDPNNKDSIFFPVVTDAKSSTGTSTVKVESKIKTYEPEKSIYDYDILGTSASGLNNGLLLRRQAFDTALQAPQVAVNARVAGQLDLYSNVLHRVDELAETRYFHKAQRNNLYAADPDVIDDSRIDHKYTPYVNQEDGGCTWLKALATIEHNSPYGQSGYKNRAYNAFLGYEAPVATLRNGWDLINTVFGGYQGSYQDYDDVQNYQNGGSGGYMANLYHNNFFAGGVVMLGGTNVDVQDSGRHHRNLNFGLFDIGASTRVGYNVGMGKHWLFQPMVTASYIYVTGMNKHNGKGEDVHLDGTGTFQLAPGFKIVGNYNGWQPYVLLDYTWPINAKTKASVNDIALDDIWLRSYIEYGVGLRKNLGERFVGHLEAVMRNGGRTGVSFQGGLVFKF